MHLPPFAPDFSRCSGSSHYLALTYIKMVAEHPLALLPDSSIM